ncbi:MAG: gliding motility-associated C-terminal domain-containing protein [Flavobacterium sp.]
MKNIKNNLQATLSFIALLFYATLSAQQTDSSPACTNPVITAILPTTGPVGTTVTITGSGFQAGAGISGVKFGGVAAVSFTIVSDTSLKAIVPPNANSGAITATTETCTGMGANFTVLYSNCTSSSAGGNEIYISELYDQRQGSGGMVELYNPTNNPIVLTGTYVLQRYGNVVDNTPSNGYILNLTGTIDPESTFLVAGSVPNPAICIAPPMNNNNQFISGFNDNDKIELLKNGQRIDIANTPASQPGFTMIRKPDAAAPDDVYNSSAWNITLHNTTVPNNYCDNLGSHGVEPVPLPVISQQPANSAVCPGSDTLFEITVSAPAGFTYQWKVLNAAGIWVNVMNNTNYSGATTKKLELHDIPASFAGNQYYCVATAGACILLSNVAQFTFATLPAAPVALATPATCTTAAIITVTPVAGMTYSINGTDYQASNIFNNVPANTYYVTVKNAAGCISPAFNVTVNPAPGAPATPQLTQTSPTCTVTTGTITVAPVAGLEYSLDGGAYQASNLFSNVIPGLHTVTVKNVAGCTAVNTITINAVPDVPAVPVLSQIPPTCTLAAVITAASVAGAEYSLDGGPFQASNEFNVTVPGMHTVTVRNAAGCTSSNTISVDPAPGAPAVPVATATPATCTTAAIITVTPVVGMTYSINGNTYQASNIFNNVAAGIYNVTVKNAAGCVSLPFAITVAPAPGAPAAPVATQSPATCTAAATITVTPVAGMEYSIGNGYQASNIFSNVPAGTYQVTVRNASGCISPAFQVIVAPAPSTPSAPTATQIPATCSAAATITINPVAGMEYSIGGSYQASNVFTNVSQGTYGVTVRNAAGCVSPAFQIIIAPAPAGPATPVATQTPATCSTSASITVTPVAGMEYSIGNGYQASNIFNNLPAATYNVTVRNAQGCVSAPFSITIAPAPAGPAAPVVAQTPATCTAAASIAVTAITGMEYSIGSGYQTSNIFNNVPAGTYQVTVRNAQGCISASTQIIVAPAPTIPANPAATQVAATCNTAASITVASVAGMEYSIGGGYQTSNIFNNVPQGTYNITVRNSAGCISPAFQVIVAPAPVGPATPSASQVAATCSTAASITVTPVAGMEYSIGSGYQVSNVFNNVAAGTYNVTVRNAQGCVSPAFSLIVNPAAGTVPQIGSAEGCRETVSGKKYILEALPLDNSFDVATATFDWRDASGQLLQSGESTFNVTEYAQENIVQFPIEIRVTVISAGGCSNTYPFTINGIFCDVQRGISPNNDEKNDSFNLAGMNVSRLSIFNRYGKEVYSRTNYVNEWHGQGTNDDELPTGTYYYVIETNTTSKTGWVYINREN